MFAIKYFEKEHEKKFALFFHLTQPINNTLDEKYKFAPPLYDEQRKRERNKFWWRIFFPMALLHYMMNEEFNMNGTVSIDWIVPQAACMLSAVSICPQQRIVYSKLRSIICQVNKPNGGNELVSYTTSFSRNSAFEF